MKTVSESIFVYVRTASPGESQIKTVLREAGDLCAECAKDGKNFDLSRLSSPPLRAQCTTASPGWAAPQESEREREQAGEREELLLARLVKVLAFGGREQWAARREGGRKGRGGWRPSRWDWRFSGVPFTEEKKGSSSASRREDGGGL